MKLNFVYVVDRESTNPLMSNNGGDYEFGRVIALDSEGNPVGVRFYVSADFGTWCDHCGSFGHEKCGMEATLEDANIDNSHVVAYPAIEQSNYDRGYFAAISK